MWKIHHVLQQTTLIKFAYAKDETFATPVSACEYEYTSNIIDRVQCAEKALFAERNARQVFIPTLIEMRRWISSLGTEIRTIWKSIHNTLEYLKYVEATILPGDERKRVKDLTQIDTDMILANIQLNYHMNFYLIPGMSCSEFKMLLPAWKDAFRNDTRQLYNLDRKSVV